MYFSRRNGRTIIVRAHHPDEQALPFGAEVFNGGGLSLGVVGQNGQTLLRGIDQGDVLTARWQDDDGKKHSCSFPYTPSKQPKHDRHASKFEEQDAVCQSTDTGT